MGNKTLEPPVDIYDYQTFKQPPSAAEIAAWKEIVETTGQPEAVPELYLGRIPPDLDFEILTQINTGKKRLYCPICNQMKKFSSGYLALIAGLNVIAVIGPECADPERRDAAKLKYRQQKKRREQADFLAVELPRLPELARHLDVLMPRAFWAQEIAGKFVENAKAVRKTFDSIRRTGGMLTVERKAGAFAAALTLESGQKGRALQAHEDIVGRLKPCPAIGGAFYPQAELQRLIATLNAEAYATPEAVDAAITELRGDPIRMDLLVKALKKSLKEIRALEAEIDDLFAFFGAENFALLKRWGDDPRCKTRYVFERSEERGAIVLRIRGGGDFAVRVPAGMFPNESEGQKNGLTRSL